MTRFPVLAAMVCAAAVFAVPATAQGLFELPEDCTAFVTEQQRSCTVSHYFTCTTDPDGWVRRADFDEEGLVFMSAIDDETQWVESYSPRSGIAEVIGEKATAPVSFTNLLATGIDRFDFTTRSEPDGAVTRFIGEDRLTGEKLVVDGVTLERTEFSMVARDENGTEIWRSHGREFINREWRTFFGGTRTTTLGDETWDDDSSPMAFIMPGEPGFLSTSPRYDCGALMSKAPAPGASE